MTAVPAPLAVPRGSLDAVHRRLAAYNARRLDPSCCIDGWQNEIATELRIRLLEGEFVERERPTVAEEAAAAPRDAAAFVVWYGALAALSAPLAASLNAIAVHAKLDAARELAGAPIAPRALEDLTSTLASGFGALTKRALRERPAAALVAAEAALAAALDVPPDALEEGALALEALASTNLFFALASNRRYAFHALGALGVLEEATRARIGALTSALERLGVVARVAPGAPSRAPVASYGEAVIAPLVATCAASTRSHETFAALAEGALLQRAAIERLVERSARRFM